jgi:hypothetical protein
MLQVLSLAARRSEAKNRVPLKREELTEGNLLLISHFILLIVKKTNQSDNRNPLFHNFKVHTMLNDKQNYLNHEILH